MTEVNNAAVQAALKSAGVEFIEENGGGAGVRLRKTKAPRCAYSDAREGVRNSLSAPAGTVAVFYFSRLGSVIILCSSSPFTRAPVAPTIPAPLRHHREFKRRPLSIIIIIPSVPVMAVMPIMVAMTIMPRMG
jgi:hypothetical protein